MSSMLLSGEHVKPRKIGTYDSAWQPLAALLDAQASTWLKAMVGVDTTTRV